MSGFLFSNAVIVAGWKHYPISENNFTKMIGICVCKDITSLIHIYTIHIFWCIYIPDVTASYGMPFDFIVFFGYFHNLLLVRHVLTSNFFRLCVKVEKCKVEKKTYVINNVYMRLVFLSFPPNTITNSSKPIPFCNTKSQCPRS